MGGEVFAVFVVVDSFHGLTERVALLDPSVESVDRNVRGCVGKVEIGELLLAVGSDSERL